MFFAKSLNGFGNDSDNKQLPEAVGVVFDQKVGGKKEQEPNGII